MTELHLKNLVKVYGEHRAVDGISITVESGTVVGLLGPNGAGKTTTFYMAVGMIPVDDGSIMIDDDDITHLPMYMRARKGIGYLPQEVSIFRKLTVAQNILIVLEALISDRNAREEKMTSLLSELGILHLQKRKAALLSGGERRRLEICRTLATDPAFILLDEPFAGIDPLAVSDLQEIIRHLAKRGIGVLISDHNVRETLGVCDTAYIVKSGRIIESGPPDKIADSPIAKEYYLGNHFRL